MSKRLQWLFLAAIMLAAAYFRFNGLDWDDYNHYHPDERYISWVGTTIEIPDDWLNALDPQLSTFNPFYWPKNAESEGIVVSQDQQRRFAYGHLPLYAGVAASKIASLIGPALAPILPDDSILVRDILNDGNLIEYRHLTAAGRALTALVDTLTVGLVFILGKQLFGPMTGLLAAAFLAFNVMHIQLAHFFVVDPYLTFFVVASITSMVAATQSQLSNRAKIGFLSMAAVAGGLAVGAKINGLLLLLPLALTVMITVRRSTRLRILTFLALLGLVFLVFAVTNPFAILDFSCAAQSPVVNIGPIEIPSINWGSCYLMNTSLQGSMVRGIRDVPFVRQYFGTTPFLYQIEMQLKWGMGLVLGIAAFAGFLWAIWRVAFAAWTKWREFKRGEGLSITPVHYGPNAPAVYHPEFIVSAWTLPFFLLTGLLAVKFMRYMQPLTPFLMIYAAAMLLTIPLIKIRRLLILFVLAVTILYSISFISIYDQPHPWIEASQWIYKQIEPNSRILSEVWDDSLPDNLTVGNTNLKKEIYMNDAVNWLSGTGILDNEDKLSSNLAKVADSDVIVIVSNRNYGVISRLKELYPLSSQYYPLLFDGSLGYELSFVTTRTPSVLGLNLVPDPFGWPELNPPELVDAYFDELGGISLGRFDESFTVYDQPLVMIFKNQERLSAEEMAEQFH
ncbi:MAG: hypothetical protein BMS9Abin02_1082 [Anaerolineae bacterium]|nr:MAG: hypothetical protein BMS9Abin02_1082 [Anaerolineae bacterium]